MKKKPNPALLGSMENLPLIEEERKDLGDLIHSDAHRQVQEISVAIPSRSNFRAKTKKSTTKRRPVVIMMESENSNKPIFGSLFDMFQSEMFTLPMLMQYYYKKFDNHGIHVFLTNKLFSYSNEMIEFYLPQLCYLMIKQSSQYLEKLMFDKCSQSIPLFLMINWCFIAFSDADQKDKKKQGKIKKTEEQIEQAMINGQFDVTQENSQSVRDYFLEKAQKLKYQQSVNLFITNLIELSLILKTHKIEDRKRILKDYISKANKALERYRDRNREVDYCHGIQFPFSADQRDEFDYEAHEEDDNNVFKRSNMIVRIIEDECTCFNTKKRVPYRIVLETIDIKELERLQPKLQKMNYLTKRSRSELDLDSADAGLIDDFLNQSKQGKEALEMMLKEIVDSKRNRNFGDLLKLQQDLEQQQEVQKQASKGQTFFKNLINQVQETKGKEKEIAAMEVRLNKVISTRQQVQVIMQQRKKFDNEKESQQFDMLMKRFEILFPTTHNSRSQSCVSMFTEGKKKIKKSLTQLEQMFDFNRHNNYRFKHTRGKDLNSIKRIVFFKKMFRLYPNKENKLREIYKNLQYDLYDSKYQRQLNLMKQAIKDDGIEYPSRFGPWEVLWDDKAQVIHRSSPYENFQSYRLRPIIVKGGDDLRQELMAMQIINIMKNAFKSRGVDLWVKAYEITVVSASSGILEFCTDTLSIDGLKKKMSTLKTLNDIYRSVFASNFDQAQMNFIESLAAYSIICFLLQIKDRHNGNMLIDSSGHIIHIDFGFMLNTSPGGINFENAPFKLTSEYADIMDGKKSEKYALYKELMFQGFTALKKVVDDIITIIQIMMEDSDLPCFEKFDLEEFRGRFFEKSTDKELREYVNVLIEHSYDNWRTIQYDHFQKMTNGINP